MNVIDDKKYIGSVGQFSLYPDNIIKIEVIDTHLCIWFSNNEQPDMIMGHENKEIAEISKKGLERLCKKIKFKLVRKED